MSNRFALGMGTCGPPATGPMTTASPTTTGYQARGFRRQKSVSFGRRAIGAGEMADISSIKAIGESPWASTAESITVSAIGAEVMGADVGTTDTSSTTGPSTTSMS